MIFPDDARARAGVADTLAPPEDIKPSEWAEHYRMVKEGHTDRPGRWSNDYFPWQRPIMDLIVDEPDKDGFIYMKAAQIGGSEAVINDVGWIVCQQPGPVLYLISTDEEARRFGLHRFEYMIDSAPVLGARFKRGKQLHETILVKEFYGGLLVIAGGGSANKLMSDPQRYVLLDEVDQLPESYPKVGSPWMLAKARTRSFARSFIAAWSTPTEDGRGIAQLYNALSDMRRFFVPCPHCGEDQWLKFGQVRWDEDDRDSAFYECEHCKEPIRDAQRAAAVQKGHFKSTLPDDEAKKRRFAGFHISQLYNPRIPLGDIVGEWLDCRNEEDRQGFYNTILGEPYTKSTQPITAEMIDARAVHEPQSGAPPNTMFLTAGIDVQHGDWFYVDVSAWTDSRIKYLIEYPRIQGWERLKAFLRGFEVGEGKRKLKIRRAAIDCGFNTTIVYAFCAEVGLNFLLPVKYGSVPAAEFWTLRDIKTYPGIKRYDLARFYWMDRGLARFTGDEASAGTILPAGISDEYRNHILANVRQTVVNRFGYEEAAWIKPQGAQDDYLQAGVMAEFAAVTCGLDQFKAKGEEIKKKRLDAFKKFQAERRQKEPWIKRRTKTGSWIKRP